MNKVKTRVHAGVCGYVTEIVATTEDEQMVQMAIESPCGNIRSLAAGLPGELDAYEELGAGWNGAIHQAALGALKGCCSGCVVPSSIFKSMQIAAGLALPRDISIEFGSDKSPA